MLEKSRFFRYSYVSYHDGGNTNGAYRRTSWNSGKSTWPEYGGKIMEMLPGSIMRVIPVNESVEPESQILAYDNVIKIIEDAKILSVTDCSRRVIDGACGKPLELCMQVDCAAPFPRHPCPRHHPCVGGDRRADPPAQGRYRRIRNLHPAVPGGGVIRVSI